MRKSRFSRPTREGAQPDGICNAGERKAGRMTNLFFPTSEDIYLEVNGRRLAVVESYRARSTRRNRYVEASGEEEPVGVSRGPLRHEVELSRVRSVARRATASAFAIWTTSTS